MKIKNLDRAQAKLAIGFLSKWREISKPPKTYASFLSMLPFFHLHATVSKSIISCLIIPSSPKPLIPSYSPIRFFHFQTPKRFACIRSQMSSSSATQVAAEYAKSGRSSCKKCSQPIEAKALRLGLISRDERGFDVTKWHHLDCFDFGSQNVASVEKIKGFQSLKVLARISILGFALFGYV